MLYYLILINKGLKMYKPNEYLTNLVGYLRHDYLNKSLDDKITLEIIEEE